MKPSLRLYEPPLDDDEDEDDVAEIQISHVVDFAPFHFLKLTILAASVAALFLMIAEILQRN